MHAAVVTVGTELLLGIGADTNARYLCDRLTDLGFTVKRILSVPDDVEAVAEAAKWAARGCELLCITGGLGPTFDDVTREGVARAFKLRLRRDRRQAEWVARRYREWGRDIPEFALRQADLIGGAEFLAAATGTAAGQAFEHGGVLCALLPGVPAEMTAMFEDELAGRIEQRFKTSDVRRIRRIRVCGLTESDVQVRIDKVREAYPAVGFTVLAYPEEIQVVLREGEGLPAAIPLDRVSAEAEAALGDSVCGKNEQTLEATVVGLLAAGEMTLATAESCTGGLVAKRITDVPGASAVFMGGVVAYSDEAKKDWLSVPRRELGEHGAVSSPVARHMAESVRLVRRATYGLAVTGIAGPGGGSADKPVGLTYFALADETHTVTERRVFGGDRDAIRRRAAQVALDLLRRAVSDAIAGQGSPRRR